MTDIHLCGSRSKAPGQKPTNHKPPVKKPPKTKAPQSKMTPIQKAPQNNLPLVTNFPLLQIDGVYVPPATTYTRAHKHSKDVTGHI